MEYTLQVTPTPELQAHLQRLVEQLYEQGIAKVEEHAEEMLLGLLGWLRGAGLLQTACTDKQVLEWYKDYLRREQPIDTKV